LLEPARYKGVYGGRGSGKSHFFGELLVETCQAERGTLAVCIREAQRTLAQSSKRLIESKIAALGLGHQFKPFSDKIETPGDGLIIFRGMHHQSRLSALSTPASLGLASHAVLAKVGHRQGEQVTAQP
jgi:phage terminase large subunit